MWNLYPFSHNHGIMENWDLPYMKKKIHILEGPIFDFHDYGSKGTPKGTPSKTNISHLGKRKIIDSNMPYQVDMLVPWRVKFQIPTVDGSEIR